MRAGIVSGMIVGSLALSGCAGKHFVSSHPLHSSGAVMVTSAPAGAVATTEYGDSCTTPCRLALLSDRGGEITVSHEGYRTQRHFIGTSVSEARIARQTTDLAWEAVDPEPASMALTALAAMVDPGGSVRSIDKHDLHVDLVALEDGEEDLLAPAEPLTGERIPIDLEDTPAS